MSNNFFKWDEDFNTGNSQIDSQHFALVEMINELLELSVNNAIIELEIINDISSKLSEYVKMHFSTEDALMEKYEIDQRHLSEHRQCHKEFVSQITNQFSDSIKLQNPKNINDIVEYLIRWLAYHILSTDKSLVRQLNYIINDKMSPLDAFEKENRITESSAEPFLKALKVLYLLVSRKNKEIESKNKELEEKVKLRTSELSEANEKLSHMLFRDVLTGLPNRRFVMDEIEKLISNWERYEVHFSILFIDVDKFKAVNDNYGHENGDKVLKWIANFIKSNIRETDIACRLSGDEFIIICSNTTEDGALSIGKKLNLLCKKEWSENLEFWKPSLSIGISTITNKVSNSNELLKAADSAMYRSKTKGGGITSLATE